MQNKKHKKLRTFAILIAIAAVIIHIINKIIVMSANFKEMLEILNKKYFDSKFGKIYYTKHGKGTPILLIHDSLPGSSGYEWSRVEKLIAMDHTVYTIDLLGYGRSDKPGITYTNFLYVQLINEFVEKVIKEKTNVISCGFSNSFVVMACNNNKDLFNKVMLINPPSLESLNQQLTLKDKVLSAIIKTPIFGTFVYHIIVSRETIATQFAENLYYNPSQIDRDIVESYYEASHKGGYYAKYVYSSLISKKMNACLSNGIKNMTQEVVILSGESELNASTIANMYTELNPAINTKTIKCSKHFPQIECPERFLSQVSSFFS